MERCDFCNNILTKEEYFQLDWIDRLDGIIKESDDKYTLYSACDDPYYNHVVLDDTNYCPKCGRKLHD